VPVNKRFKSETVNGEVSITKSARSSSAKKIREALEPYPIGVWMLSG
jgi:hypothetical protein